jgi:hypothetical protein
MPDPTSTEGVSNHEITKAAKGTKASANTLQDNFAGVPS